MTERERRLQIADIGEHVRKLAIELVVEAPARRRLGIEKLLPHVLAARRREQLARGLAEALHDLWIELTARAAFDHLARQPIAARQPEKQGRDLGARDHARHD